MRLKRLGLGGDPRQSTRGLAADGGENVTHGCRLSAQEEHLCHRERFRVGEGQQRRLHPDPLGASGGAAMQPQLRRAGYAYDFQVFPEHAARVASAERLHARFLRGEPSGEVRYRVPSPRTIGDLAFREDAVQEPVAVAIHRLCNPRDVGGVESKPDDGHDPAPA